MADCNTSKFASLPIRTMPQIKKFTVRTIFLSLFWALCAQLAIAGGQPTLPQVVLDINGNTLLTEVAETPEQRHKGLSFRKNLGEDAAMLFVYRAERPLFFTMQDASIPLSIAYLSKDLVINEIVDMKPFTRGPYPSAKPAMYALEVNQGWFRQHNIKVGDRVIYR